MATTCTQHGLCFPQQMAYEASRQWQDGVPQMQPQQHAAQPQVHPALRGPGPRESSSSDSSSFNSQVGGVEAAMSGGDSSSDDSSTDDDTGGSDSHWHETVDGPYDPSLHSDSSSSPVGASSGTLHQSAQQQNEPIRLFVAVISMAANRDRRDAVRATWGSDKRCDCTPHWRMGQLPRPNMHTGRCEQLAAPVDDLCTLGPPYTLQICMFIARRLHRLVFVCAKPRREGAFDALRAEAVRTQLKLIVCSICTASMSVQAAPLNDEAANCHVNIVRRCKCGTW